MSESVEEKEPLHVFEWLELPPANEGEKHAKEWLDEFLKSPARKDTAWLEKVQINVTWKGKEYICSGASRLGDVWLRKFSSEEFYDHRVNVEELSNWKKVLIQQ